jgi:hypothetical protein
VRQSTIPASEQQPFIAFARVRRFLGPFHTIRCASQTIAHLLLMTPDHSAPFLFHPRRPPATPSSVPFFRTLAAQTISVRNVKRLYGFELGQQFARRPTIVSVALKLDTQRLLLRDVTFTFADGLFCLCEVFLPHCSVHTAFPSANKLSE